MKKRLTFVSNSSSSSYIVDYDTFQKWLDQGNEFKLNTKILNLHEYMDQDKYSLIPYPKNWMENYFIYKITEDDFKVVEEKEFYKMYTNDWSFCERHFIIDKFKDLIPNFVKLFNDVVQYKSSKNKEKFYDSKSIECCELKKLINKYYDYGIKYTSKICILLQKKLDNIKIVKFTGDDCLHTVENYYLDDEQYARDIGGQLCRFNTLFWRADTCH